MPEKHKKEHIRAVVDKLFDIAGSKMKDEHDKNVLIGLKQLVAQVQEDLY